MNKTLINAFVRWLPFTAAISGVFIFAYWAVQQEYRISLNDPQVEMAEDASSALAAGASVDNVVPPGKVDIASSLAPWLAVYDGSGTLLSSSGELDGAPPHLPTGVFNESTWHTYAEYGVPLTTPADETRFTWQPEPGVRQAVVLVHTSVNGVNRFVASGRNMREVENREGTLTEGAALAWAGTELGTLIVIVALLALGWL